MMMMSMMMIVMIITMSMIVSHDISYNWAMIILQHTTSLSLISSPFHMIYAY